MRSIIALFLCLLVGSAVAQSKQIEAPQFSRLSISGPFKVTLIKADKSRAEIDYRGVDPDDVIAECSGDEFEIKIRHRSFFNFDDKHYDRNGKRASVTIYYTSLKSIDAKEGASLSATEMINADRLKIKSRMGSEVTLALHVNSLALESSMGSEVDLSGTAEDFELRASMGADVDASQFKCQDVSVSASMGADVKVYAERTLDASANFGASVSCKGNPSKKHTSGTFGADFN